MRPDQIVIPDPTRRCEDVVSAQLLFDTSGSDYLSAKAVPWPNYGKLIEQSCNHGVPQRADRCLLHTWPWNVNHGSWTDFLKHSDLVAISSSFVLSSMHTIHHQKTSLVKSGEACRWSEWIGVSVQGLGNKSRCWSYVFAPATYGILWWDTCWSPELSMYMFAANFVFNK